MRGMKTNRLLAPRIDADNPLHAPSFAVRATHPPNRHVTIHEPPSRSSLHRRGPHGPAGTVPCPPPHLRRSTRRPARTLRRRMRVRHSRRAYRRALSRARRVVDPPCDAAPRTGRRLHGRRLCPRHRPAGRLLHHHRARHDQYRDRDGTGLRGFDPDAGDLERQRAARARQRRRPPARAAVAAQRLRGAHRVLAHAAGRGRPAAGPRARIRRLRKRAATARAYRDSARRDRDAGARAARHPARAARAPRA